jgi:transposase
VEEVCYRLGVQAEALVQAEDEPEWFVLATTVGPDVCSDAHIVQAYREQTTTVEPGFRWIKNPAAIAPVWLEKPERIAALAMLTVVGLLVSSLLQRQVRLYLQHHDQQVPGNSGKIMGSCTFKFISIYVLHCASKNRRYPLWPVYGLPMRSLARQSFWISPA